MVKRLTCLIQNVDPPYEPTCALTDPAAEFSTSVSAKEAEAAVLIAAPEHMQRRPIIAALSKYGA